jgi:hypothetical protein
MNTIVVRTQAELDALPDEFAESTRIEIRSDADERIVVQRSFKLGKVVVLGKSSVLVRDAGSVIARDSSSIYVHGLSRVTAFDSICVFAYDESRVESCGSSRIVACDSSTIEAFGSSRVECYDSSSIIAYMSSVIEAWGSSRITAYEFATIAVFSDSVVIRHLADRAIARLSGVAPKIERKDETAIVFDESPIWELPFETWLERGWVVADGIHARLVDAKQMGDATVYTVRMRSGDDTESYVVRVGDHFAHGETIEQAKNNLRYKLSDRDTSQFKAWALNDEKTLDDLMDAYRMITGACEFGVRNFIESAGDFPKKMTVAQAIERTRGQYGHEKFAEFFRVG